MAVLRQAESGVAVPELCREHGISTASFYKWRSKYGGMDASMMSQMKALALIRQILTVAGTALVAKGYVHASDIEPVIGALLTIVSVVWSVADKRGR